MRHTQFGFFPGLFDLSVLFLQGLHITFYVLRCTSDIPDMRFGMLNRLTDLSTLFPQRFDPIIYLQRQPSV